MLAEGKAMGQAAKRLHAGNAIYGTMLRMIRHPGVAAMAHDAGLDFIMLDMEHGAYTLVDVSSFSLTAGRLGLDIFVRIPELSRAWVSTALDCGATGVMCPMLETEEQAKMLVRWAKYPPVGERGLATTGSHTMFRKAASAESHMAETNDAVVAIAQIETRLGVESAGRIARVEGIDALLVGPNDLSVSLGCPGEMASPKLQQAIGRVTEGANEAGTAWGMHAPAAFLRQWQTHGMRLVMSALDVDLLRSGLEAVASDLRSIDPTA